MEKLHTDLLNEREGKKGKKSKSGDLSKRSLKTHKETDSREPTQKYLKRERGDTEEEQGPEQQVSEDRQGDRQQGTYTGIDIRKTSLRTDGETESRHLHRDLSKERQREEERKRARAEI